MTEERMVQLYQATGSIRAVSLYAGVSYAKARKMLLNAGALCSDRAEEVKALLARGLTEEQAAAQLGISVKALRAYLPYTRGAYFSDTPARNALYIRAWKERKRNSKKADQVQS